MGLGEASVWMVHGGVNASMLLVAGADLRRGVALSRVDWRTFPGVSSLASAEGTGAFYSGLSSLRAELEAAIDETTPGTSRVAALNEATREFESLLGSTRGRSLGWRVCLASGIAWGCLLAAREPAAAAWCITSGAVGAALTWQLGRMADSCFARVREQWNGLIRRSSGSFPQGEPSNGSVGEQTEGPRDNL